jgi:DNA-binding response OmpR family regulator
LGPPRIGCGPLDAHTSRHAGHAPLDSPTGCATRCHVSLTAIRWLVQWSRLVVARDQKNATLRKPESDEGCTHATSLLCETRCASRGILQVGDLQLNTSTREVWHSERKIELTATEYNLLHLFMSYPRQVLDRQTILNRVWGYDFLGETNVIEVYVRFLREKLEDSPSTPHLIQTVRGVGYVLKG